jgi:hypothetical protein
MKHPLLKIPVVLFSISAAAAYVWHASQKNSTEPAPAASAGVAVEAEANDFSSPQVVTEDEIRAVRESMLSTSKSGIIMKDDDIRELLETQKSAGFEPKPSPPGSVFIPSTKNPSRIIPPSVLKNLIENNGEPPAPNNPLPQNLAPSSKSLSPVFSSPDLKKLIEKSAQNPLETPDESKEP